MEIIKNYQDQKLTVILKGKLDILTSPELEKSMTCALDGISELVFDFTDLDYISSSGLRVLLATQKKMNAAGGKMIVTGVNEVVAEVFEVTGFDRLLMIR